MTKGSAVLMILCGAVCMSTVGMFLRLIDDADGFQILFHRSVAMIGVLMLAICIRRKTNPLRLLRSLDRQDFAMGTALAAAFITYVFSMLNTTVASTLFILSATPLLAAALGWAFIGEKPHPFAWVAMAIASAGVLVMVADGLGSGKSLGNLLALASGAAFAIMLVLARKGRKTDVLGGTLFGCVLTTLVSLVLAVALGNGIQVAARDLSIILLMGAVGIGLGICLVTWATPFVPAAEVSILVLVESVLGPFWVWLLGFETVTGSEVAGGSIVLGAVVSLAVVSGRRPAPRPGVGI